jgi:pantothenate kinase
MAKPESLFDKRVVERHIQSGLVSREEHQKYLKSLKDLGENAQKLDAELLALGRSVPTRNIGNEEEEL